MKSYVYFMAAAVLLIAGTVNYYLFNPGILLFEWFSLQTSSLPAAAFVKNHVSDLCWCLALCMTTRAVLLNKMLNTRTAYLLLLVPPIAELLQLAGVLPGTFDMVDLLIYCTLSVSCWLVWAEPAAGRFQPRFAPLAALFLLMSLACATPKSSYQPPKPLPCVTHKGLTYSPVLVTMYISGSYNMKDLAEVQRTLPPVLLDKMNALNPYKYKMADGVKPNLSLYVTYTTDSYGHYGAEIKGYLFDGDFYTTLAMNYVTWEKLDADIVAKVNTFISYGWCSNCPSPCNP